MSDDKDVPPAGGEVEVLAWMYRREGGEILGRLVSLETKDLKHIREGKRCEGRTILTPRSDYFDWIPLVDLAHVTRLTAERDALKAEKAELEEGWYRDDSDNQRFWPEEMDAIEAERDALQSEVKRIKLQQFTWLWTHCRAIGMTEKSDSGTMEHDIAQFTIDLQSELTKARELLSDAVDDAKRYLASDAGWTRYGNRRDEIEAEYDTMLAHQSTPAAKGVCCNKFPKCVCYEGADGL